VPVPVSATPTGAAPSWPTASGTGGLPSALPTRGVSSPAAAPDGVNDAYMGRRLMYNVPPEHTFDPLGSNRFLDQVRLRAQLYVLSWGLGFSAFLVLFLVTNIGSIASSINSSANSLNQFGEAAAPASSPINGFGYFLIVIMALFSLVLAICFWFLKVPIQLSEWKITVDGKGMAAPTVFGHIAAVLYERRAPIAPMRAQRFKLPSAPRDYLELNSGIFYGYVACFAYGRDLYIGWTYWSRLSPIRYVFMFLARLWQSLFNRGSDLYVSLRYDSARALRETIHSATREGVDVAVGRLEAQGQGIIGSAIPVTEHTGTE
jgi:hypothetical protein